MSGELWRALGICPRDLVALVGADSSQALARRLEQELGDEGRTAGSLFQGSASGEIPAAATMVVPVLPVAGGDGANWAERVLDLCRETPAGARVVPLLVEPERLAGGAPAPAVSAAAASLLLGLQAGRSPCPVGRVVAVGPEPVGAVTGRYGDVAALVLAGGASRRFGASKLLHPWGEESILEASLRAVLQAGLAEVAVVTGAYHPELASLLAPYPVRLVENRDWGEGMSTSVKAGLQALAAGEPRAIMICLGDQPMLPPEVVAALAGAHRRTGAAIVAPAIGGVRKSPVLFDRSLWPELLLIQGDEGGRRVVQAHQEQVLLLEYDREEWFRDIDRPEDLPPGR